MALASITKMVASGKRGRPAEVASLVRALQAARITLAWSADPMATSKGFADIASTVAATNA